MSCHSRVIAQRQVDVSPLCHCCATVESVAASFQRHFAIFDDNIIKEFTIKDVMVSANGIEPGRSYSYVIG